MVLRDGIVKIFFANSYYVISVLLEQYLMLSMADLSALLEQYLILAMIDLSTLFVQDYNISGMKVLLGSIYVGMSTRSNRFFLRFLVVVNNLGYCLVKG